MIELVFMDLDGTLLGSDGSISCRARAALAALAARGVPIILASGRPPRLVRCFQHELNLAGPAICYNGALIAAHADGGVLWEKRIPRCTALAVTAVLKRAGIKNILYEAADRLSGELTPELQALADREKWGLRPDISADEAMVGGVHKILAICSHPLMKIAETIAAALPGEVDTVTSAPGTDWLEILPVGASKAAAAEIIGKRLGIDLANAAAFGDAANDAGLLARVGLGVAMANGDNTAKAAASRLAPANDRDGVALLLEELLAAG